MRIRQLPAWHIKKPPHLANLLATYSGGDVAEYAAVKVWLGELAAQGMLPVTLPKVKVKSFEV